MWACPPPHLPLPIQSIINFRHINKQPQPPTACDNKAPQLRVVSYPPWWWVACGGADTEELDDAAEEGTGGEEGGAGEEEVEREKKRRQTAWEGDVASSAF